MSEKYKNIKKSVTVKRKRTDNTIGKLNEIN